MTQENTLNWTFLIRLLYLTFRITVTTELRGYDDYYIELFDLIMVR